MPDPAAANDNTADDPPQPPDSEPSDDDSPPVVPSDDPGVEPDPAGDDDPDAEPPADEPPDPITGLSSEEQQAAESAVAALSLTVEAMALSAPAVDVEAMLEGAPGPACPQLALSFTGQAVEVEASYDPACQPDHVPGAVATGRVAGTLTPEFGVVDLDLQSASLRDDPLTGAVAGTALPDGAGILFFVTIEVEAASGASAYAVLTEAYLDSDAAASLPSGTLTVYAGGVTWTGTIEDVSIPAADALLLPDAGVVHLSPNPPTEQRELTVTFSAATATDGLITVQAADEAAVAVSLPAPSD